MDFCRDGRLYAVRAHIFARHRMSLPLPLFIGLRYVRARSSHFVSFISWVSMLGVVRSASPR